MIFLERESNPRHSESNSDALPTELSSEWCTGIEPATCEQMPAALTAELTPLRETPSCVSGIRHGRAARTGWSWTPRRWRRSSDASHCRRSRIGNSCDRCLRIDHVGVPLRTPPASKHHNARECVWQRALGLSVGIGAGCFRAKRKVKGNHAGMPAWARTRVVWTAGRPAVRPLETKRPRRASEGVRVPRRSGRPISRKGDQSAVEPMSNRAAPYPARHRPCSRQSRDIGLFCWWLAGFIRRAVVVMWKGCIAFVLRWARTLHPYFFECKHFFYIRRRMVRPIVVRFRGAQSDEAAGAASSGDAMEARDAIRAAARDRRHGSRRSSGARRRC
jgi:hypothetical protein